MVVYRIIVAPASEEAIFSMPDINLIILNSDFFLKAKEKAKAKAKAKAKIPDIRINILL